VNCFAIPDFVTDEQALFMSDAVPTGYMEADFCDIAGGDTVAVWGAGAVGLMAARSALLNGAGRVISIDRIPERLALAEKLGAETINYAEVDSSDGRGARGRGDIRRSGTTTTPGGLRRTARRAGAGHDPAGLR
jgi:threonine dehydrogenase-like Zn-dependent dehydrogenase